MSLVAAFLCFFKDCFSHIRAHFSIINKISNSAVMKLFVALNVVVALSGQTTEADLNTLLKCNRRVVIIAFCCIMLCLVSKLSSGTK